MCSEEMQVVNAPLIYSELVVPHTIAPHHSRHRQARRPSFCARLMFPANDHVRISLVSHREEVWQGGLV